MKNSMRVDLIKTDKKRFLPMLLLADEQENMIDKYLGRGELFALYDDDILRATCVVTKENDDIYEIKSLATAEEYQGQGYGKAMVDYVFENYKNKCKTILVGTGESPLTMGFYEKCGFVFSHRVANFFVHNYDHPMFEDGNQLIDMIYYKKDI